MEKEMNQQCDDNVWQHAACLTIAETGAKWGKDVIPSPAMKAVYELRKRYDLLLKAGKEALSALYGCREVVGNIGNIQHAIDLLLYGAAIEHPIQYSEYAPGTPAYEKVNSNPVGYTSIKGTGLGVNPKTIGEVFGEMSHRSYLYELYDKTRHNRIEIVDGFLTFAYTGERNAMVRSSRRIRDWAAGTWDRQNIRDDLNAFLVTFACAGTIELRLTREQATAMAKSEEVRDYINRGPYACSKAITQSNIDRCGLPDMLYGLRVVVEPQGGPAPSRTWVGIDPAAYPHVPGSWTPLTKNDWKPFPKPPSPWPINSNGEPLLIKDVAVLMMLPLSEVESLIKDATWYTAWQEAAMKWRSRKECVLPLIKDVRILTESPFPIPLVNPHSMVIDPELNKALTTPPEPAEHNRAAAMADEANYPSISAGGPPLRSMNQEECKEAAKRVRDVADKWVRDKAEELKEAAKRVRDEAAKKVEKACPMPSTDYNREAGQMRLIIDNGTRYSFTWPGEFELATLAMVKDFIADKANESQENPVRYLKLDMTTTKVQIERKRADGTWETKVL